MARKTSVNAEKTAPVKATATKATASKTTATKTAPAKATATKTVAKKAKTTVSRKRSMTFDSAVLLVRKAIKLNPVKKITEKIAAEVTITGSAEGTFYIEIENGAFVVEPFDYVDKDVTVLIDTEALEAVKNKEIKISELFAKGKIQAYGDVAKAVKLLSVF